MTKKITIPQQNQPFRRQSSLGGNVSFRNLGGTDNNNYVVMAIVTKVYYKQGRVDFKLTNSTNHVVTETGDGMGSAPIPVDFYGYQRDGKIFGHYRPIQIGDLIAVAYLWGHKQSPIVLGVYPKDSSSYEFVAPQEASSFGDDRDEATYDYALGDQKIFPDGSLEYHSGNGKYFKTLRGKSFMLLDDSPLYEHLWVGYNDIGAFKDSDQNTINPLQEEAGDWLLVHEDNNEGSNSTDHRTRFYVNKDGTFQVVLSKSSRLDNLVILEGSKSNGFTLQQLYNVPQKGWIGENDPHKEPEIKNAQQYVKFNIGGSDHSATIEAATKDDSVEQATKLEIKDDGIYVNDKPLISSNPKYAGKTIIDDTISNSDGLNDAIKKAKNAAEQAAEQAKQAGEVAKAAGAAAEAAGKNALDTGDDIKKRIIYYASISKEKDIAIPGKYIIINTDTYIKNGTIKNAYIEDGAIDHAKIANEAVWSSQIANLAVTRAKIADAAIGSAQIEDLAVTDEKVGSLSADKLTTGTLDAGKINVINLNAESITAGTITADKLKIGKLSEITGDAGQLIKGHIQASDDPNAGVQIDGLDADDPNKYTPAKKAFLLSEIKRLDSAAEAAIDYGKSTGVDYSGVENAKEALHKGLDGLLAPSHLAETTEFDYNTVIKLEQDLQDAINTFHNSSNSDIIAKIGTTADGKNTIYRGTNEPQSPNLNDIWLQILNDGTYNIRVWDGGQWINPGLADIKAVENSLSGLPKSYYQPEEPVGDNIHDGDTWYKLEKGSDGTYTYTPYKRENKQWVKMLDATSSRNYIGSEPANPINGDFWMDNTTLKQYQNGDWKTIPTQGPQGVPGAKGADGISTYVWIRYSNSESGYPMFRSPVGATYIGIATGKTSPNESSVPTDYKWTKIKGDQGIQGPQGTDGKTPYVHIAYANSADGNTDFTTDGAKASQATVNNDPYQYMGTYVDYNQTSSQDHTMYKWAMIYDKSKKRNFTDQPTTPYNVGDTWTESGATYFCTRDKLTGAFDQKDWEMQQLTIHSLAPSVTNSLYNDNLLTGTSEDEKSGKSYGFADYQISGGLQPGTTYTLSGWARVDQDSLNHHQNVFVCVYSEDWSWGATLNINSALTSQYNKITFTTPNGKQLHPSVTVYLSHPDGGTNENNNDSISGMGYISKLKLEKGTVATPWCLSQSELTTTTRDYRGVTLNDRGLTATAGSTTVAMNSNDGFLINNLKDASADNPGGQVFHVDTDGNLTMKGNIIGGNITGVDFTGNNLTLAGDLQLINKEGKVGHILLGNTAVLDSQGLSLRGGGLFISDTSGENLTTHIDSKGTFITNKGVFNGSVTATSLTIPAGSSADINVAGNFMVNSSGDVIAKSITITGGTVDAGSTKFNNFSADIITTGTLDANRVAVKNLSADNITSGTLRSITINNGNNTFRVDPDGNVYANSMHVNHGSIYQGQILGADVYSISNLTSDSLDKVNDATQDWVKLKDGIIELHGANGNHYSSIVPIDVITKYSGDGASTDVHHGLGILDSREVIIGSASLDSDDNNRITHSRNFSVISRTHLGITNNYIQAQLDPDVEYGKGALFAIQKDNKVGFYVGHGENGNQVNVTTAGNNNHIAFNTNNFDVYGEVHIPDHGLTVKDLHVTHWLGVDGSKNSIVNTSQGTVAINAYETAEYYFGDIGEGQTNSNGIAYIGIEKLFNETVNTNIPYQVFLTAYGPGDIWVEQRKQDRFMVKSSQPNIKFGWEIKAKRKGYEHTRLQNVDNMIEKPAGIK